jgi:competence protein ComEA
MSENISESIPTPAPAAKSRRLFGLPPWLLVVLLFGVGGVIAWQGGLLDEVRKHVPLGAPKAAGPINLNTATEEELQSLPDIGDKVAADIVKKRPFATLEDVKKVKGIGDKKLEKLKALITIE